MKLESKLGKVLGPIIFMGICLYLIYKIPILVGEIKWKIYGCYFAAILLMSAAIMQIFKVLSPNK